MYEIALKSEVGVDYTNLHDLLGAKNWAEADWETFRVMLRASRSTDDYVGNMREFPCTDLKTIDKLWSHYSNGHFGLSVQKQIWNTMGGQLDTLPRRQSDCNYDLLYNEFPPCVGWKRGDLYLSRDNLIYSLDAPAGQLPATWVQADTVVGGIDQIFAAWVRLEACDISKISKIQYPE